MRDFILCGMLLACLAVLIGLPVGLIVASLNHDVNNALAQNVPLLKAAFMAWLVSVVIISTAGNK